MGIKPFLLWNRDRKGETLFLLSFFWVVRIQTHLPTFFHGLTMADVTLEQLAQQVAELRRENKLLAKHNTLLATKAAANHRPAAMWFNEGKDGKPDYYRVIMTDLDGSLLASLQSQAKKQQPPKLSFSLFENDFKRNDEDPDYHGRVFIPNKQ